MTVAPTVAVLICGAVAAVTTTVAQARVTAAPGYQFVDLGKSFSNEDADAAHDKATTLCYIFTDGRA